MKRVCFVTLEVVPFTAGGIGTFIHNTLKTYVTRGTEFHVLFVNRLAIDPVAFDAVFPGVVLHNIDPETYVPDEPDAILIGRNDVETRFQWQSLAIMHKLKRLERLIGAFDVIEFPDWGGFAFYSLQEKALGRAFARTMLSIRLHATDSLLRHYETRPWGVENLLLADMERKALADADLVIGHLASTADEYKLRYGFTAQWRTRVRIGLPSVIVGKPVGETVRPNPKTTSILFTSRLQSVKRPETFMEGVSDFLLSNPDYEGNVIVTAFDFDEEYGRTVRAMVPSDIAERMRFVADMPKDARETLIARSVVVLPNAFEAFCFAAYEASLLGALVVLNERNNSFGRSTPWLDRVNCRKFDGTSTGLSRVLDDIFFGTATQILEPVRLSPDLSPYWEDAVLSARRNDAARPAAMATGRAVSVLMTHADTPNELKRSVFQVLEGQMDVLEVVVADNASKAQESKIVLDVLRSAPDDVASTAAIVRIVEVPTRTRTGALLNRALAKLRGRYTALMPPGAALEPGFLKAAADALDRNPEFDFVVPAVAINGAPHDGNPLVGYFLPLGEAHHIGFHINRSCLHMLVVKTELLMRLGFDEQILADCEWELCMRAMTKGSRFIVTPHPAAFLRQSIASQLTWKSERERRANVEILRRSLSAETVGGSVPFHTIGDGELLAAERFIAPDRTHTNALALPRVSDELYNNVVAERDDWRRRYQELRGAESVQVALAMAGYIKRLVPCSVIRFGRRIISRDL